jgi:hypothetical protein
MEQRLFRDSDATDCVQLMHARRWFLIQQTIATCQSMRAQLALEVVDPRLIGARVVCRRQQLKPDSVEI